jgi:hypothetical protein
MRIHHSLFLYEVAKKPLISLPHPNILDVILKNLDYRTWLCYGSHAPTLPYFVILLLDPTLGFLRSLGAYHSHFWECKKVKE